MVIVDNINIKKIFNLILLLLLLICLFLYIVDYSGRYVKRCIFYEAIINYNINKDDDININDYYIAENEVNGDYGLIPIKLGKLPREDVIYEYDYSFSKKRMIRSERINGVWTVSENSEYFYDYEKVIEKYNFNIIVYLYNIFGFNVDI